MTAAVLLPGFMRSERLAFERDDVEDERDDDQREEKRHVLRIDDPASESFEMSREAETAERVRHVDRQMLFEKLGEAAVAEEHDHGADREAHDEADHLVLGERRD